MALTRHSPAALAQGFASSVIAAWDWLNCSWRWRSAQFLTAVAVATDASFKAYAVNEEQSNLLQRGRLGLNRLLTYTRTCKEHQPITAAQINNFAAGTVVTDIGISMFNEAGEQIDVEYDAANQRVLMNVDGGTARVLARGVVAFQVKMEPMKCPHPFVLAATLISSAELRFCLLFKPPATSLT